MLRLTKEQNEKIDKLLESKVTQKGHFMTLGDAARLIKEKLGKPEQELEEHQGEQPLETRKQFKDTVFNVGSREVDKHGQHDQSSHGGDRGGRANLPTTNERKVLIFAAKYPKGWHSYSKDKETVAAVEAVARRGDLEISRETRQFRLKRRKKVTKGLTIDEARERHARLRGKKKVTKGKITHTRAYQEVKDKPGVRSPHALAQHIVEQAGGEPKKKITKGKVMKHPGHPDQRVHSPTGRAAKPERPSSPVPSKVRARIAAQRGRERAARATRGASEVAAEEVRIVTESVQPKVRAIVSDIDRVLDGVDAGSRLYRELKGAKTAIQEWDRRRKERKSNKFLKVALVKISRVISNEITKGIEHSIDTLTESLSFIENQTPNKPLGDKKEKELKEVIEELSGVATYLMDVKDKGSFSKKTKDGLSWTTPAVADSIRRQRHRPNPKGRGVQGYNN